MILSSRALNSCSLKHWVIAPQYKVIALNTLRYCGDPSSCNCSLKPCHCSPTHRFRSQTHHVIAQVHPVTAPQYAKSLHPTPIYEFSPVHRAIHCCLHYKRNREPVDASYIHATSHRSHDAACCNRSY